MNVFVQSLKDERNDLFMNCKDFIVSGCVTHLYVFFFVQQEKRFCSVYN